MRVGGGRKGCRACCERKTRVQVSHCKCTFVAILIDAQTSGAKVNSLPSLVLYHKGSGKLRRQARKYNT